MKKPVILCIGTTAVKGDRLGPVVGDILKNRYNVDAYVYGTTSRPITGKNFLSYVSHIKKHHKGSLIIAVDACVGKAKDVGTVKLSMKGLVAGGALKRGFERVGDIGVLGVVAENGSDNLLSLRCADERTVERLASDVVGRVRSLLSLLA